LLYIYPATFCECCSQKFIKKRFSFTLHTRLWSFKRRILITESPSISAAEVFYRTFCISVYCRLPCVCVKKISSRVQSFKKHRAGKNKSRSYKINTVMRERNLIQIFGRRSSRANSNDGTFAGTFVPSGATASCNAYNVHLHYYYSTIQILMIHTTLNNLNSCWP